MVNWYAKQICQFMSGVYSLSSTVEKTFILPKLYLTKSIKKQLNFPNSIFCSMWKTEQLFIFFFFFSLIIPESTLWKRSILYYKSMLWRCSIIYYYLAPLVIDLSCPEVLYKSVLLSSKNVAQRKLTSLIIHKNVF